jgi:hypothetical protein
MVAQGRAGRLVLDAVFALFLINGLMIGATILAAIAGLRSGAGDPWIGAFALGMSTMLPSILAWLASGIRSFVSPPDRDVRLGAALATAHLLLWALLAALGRLGDISTPSGWLLAIPMLGTACYGVAATWLALRWFFQRRRHYQPAVMAPGS